MIATADEEGVGLERDLEKEGVLGDHVHGHVQDHEGTDREQDQGNENEKRRRIKKKKKNGRKEGYLQLKKKT